MKKEEITLNHAKDTGLAILLILLLIVYLGGKQFVLLPAIVALVITMTWPSLYLPLAKLWFGFSHLLGLATTKVILTALFMLVVVPMAIVRRAMGADAMRCKDWKNGAASAFIEREHTYSREDLDGPY